MDPYESRLRRAYVWDPIDTDRLLALFDEAGVAGGGNAGGLWFVETDLDSTPIGLTDDEGRLVEQRSFDPNGELLNIEVFDSNHPGLDVGWHGLFFDTFQDDLHFQEHRLGQLTRGLYYNRARWYQPRHGRFMTPDPNAMGAPFQAVVAFHGDFALGVAPLSIGVESLYGDGFNLYGVSRGDTINASDPTGLFTAIDIMDAGLNALQTGLDVGGAALYGQAMQDYMSEVVMTHQVMTLADMEWALDWSMPDDMMMASGIRSYQASLDEQSSSATGPAMAGMKPLGIMGRQHGGPVHNALSKAYAYYFQKTLGEGNVRFNQGLFQHDGKGGGKIVSSMRPDVQAYDPATGQYTIIEVYDSNKPGRNRGESIAKALGKQPHEIKYTIVDRDGNAFDGFEYGKTGKKANVPTPTGVKLRIDRTKKRFGRR